MTHDWHDMLWHTGSRRFPYRIQWCAKTKTVRVKRNEDSEWTQSAKRVLARDAITHGTNALRR